MRINSKYFYIKFCFLSLIFIFISFFYFILFLNFKLTEFCNIKWIIQHGYNYAEIQNYTIHKSIPRNFPNYELNFIEKWLANNTRYGKYLLYQPTSNFLYINCFKLTETIYSFCFKTTHVNAKDVIVSGYNIFGRGPDLIKIVGQDNPPLQFPINIVGYVHTAIGLTHSPVVISSLFYNTLFPLYAIPEDVIQRSTVILPNKPDDNSHVNRFFKIFFPQTNLLFLSESEFVEVHDFHTVIDPPPGIQHYAHGILFIVDIIKNRLNLKKIEPFIYGYSNRNPQYGRSIDNFLELTEAIEKKYPSYTWKFITDRYDNFVESFKQWYCLKLILTIVGSNAIPVIMMQEGTGVFYLSLGRYDWECIALTTACNLWCYYVPIQELPHNTFYPVRADVPFIVDLLEDLIYAVNNQKWTKRALEVNKGFVRNFTTNPF